MTTLEKELNSIDITIEHKGLKFMFTYDHNADIYCMIITENSVFKGSIFVTIKDIKNAGNNFTKYVEMLTADLRNDAKFSVTFFENSQITYIDGLTWEDALVKNASIPTTSLISYAEPFNP